MKVTVYSREAVENIIRNKEFPPNTAVISFYDPAIKRIDEDYSHVDYSGLCDPVFYSELDDLDLDVLRQKGYTYDTYFPESPDIAAFIYRAYDKGMDIICQCEYGQSRSAATAAAILEHFYHNGISIFTNYDYYPNQVVYHKIFDALEKYKRCHDNRYYYAVEAGTIRSHITKLHLSEMHLDNYSHEDGNSAVDLKYDIEKALLKRNMLYHTAEEIINAFQKGNQFVYASFTATDLYAKTDRYLWEPYAVLTNFRYGYEKIDVVIWFDRIYRSDSFSGNRKRKSKRIRQLGYGKMESLSFFGKLSWDSKRKTIDAFPLIITNIQL